MRSRGCGGLDATDSVAGGVLTADMGPGRTRWVAGLVSGYREGEQSYVGFQGSLA